MGKFCCLLALIFAGASGYMAYKFVLTGETVTATDGRAAIVLEDGERNLVLGEMRAFLEAVQAITVAASNDDMDGVAKAARSVGFAAQQAVPGNLMKKLPMGFKKLGFSTHKAFDQLALDAESLGDKQQVMEALGKLMNNCVACHAAFQIQASAP